MSENAERSSSGSKGIKGFASTFMDSFGRALGYGTVAVVAALLLNWLIPSKDQIARFSWAKENVCKFDNPQNCSASADCASDEVAVGGQCIVSDSRMQKVRLFNIGISAPAVPNLSPTQHICVWEVEPPTGRTEKLPLTVKVGAVCVKQSRFGSPIVLQSK